MSILVRFTPSSNVTKFEAFGQRLMPILADVGIELAGGPEVLAVHNTIKS
jgi:hypothetical protein